MTVKRENAAVEPRSSGFAVSHRGAHPPCAACGIRDLAICAVLQDQELTSLASIASTSRATPNQTIIQEGEPAEALFNVTEGTVKIYKLLPDGRRLITGFLFAGDFLGLALNESYAYSAEAVGNARLCRFPRRRFEGLMERLPHLEKRLLLNASNELMQAQDQMLLLGRKTARERIATFLLQLSRRQVERNEAPEPVQLPMSRADIADYLGLTTETVSRTFTQLKITGIIRLLPGNAVELALREALAELADGE